MRYILTKKSRKDNDLHDDVYSEKLFGLTRAPFGWEIFKRHKTSWKKKEEWANYIFGLAVESIVIFGDDRNEFVWLASHNNNINIVNDDDYYYDYYFGMQANLNQIDFNS